MKRMDGEPVMVLKSKTAAALEFRYVRVGGGAMSPGVSDWE